MRRWFGEPWPSAEKRAPICDSDAYRVEPPIGERCLYCPDPIAEGERGVVMPSFPGPGTFWMEIRDQVALDPSHEGDVVTLGAFVDGPGVVVQTSECLVVAVHIDCLMRSTVGPELEAMLSDLAGVTRVP